MSNGNITVVYGANTQRYEAAEGMKVRDVREALGEAFRIDKKAQPHITNKSYTNKLVTEDYELQAGDTLDFLKATGQKGCFDIMAKVMVKTEAVA